MLNPFRRRKNCGDANQASKFEPGEAIGGQPDRLDVQSPENALDRILGDFPDTAATRYAISGCKQANIAILPHLPTPLILLGIHKTDHSDILSLDRLVYPEHPLTDSHLSRLLSSPGGVGCVARSADTGHLFAYSIVQMSLFGIEILSFVVSPDWRRRGIGRRMIDELRMHMNATRYMLRVAVSEQSLESHLFLRANGLRCVKILKHESGQVLYQFEQTWDQMIKEIEYI